MKLLIADDDPVTLETLCACVRSDGFDVLPAADGDAAFRLWQQHRPDLVCLDIMMPHTDGFEVCRRIRLEDPAVPVLFLSAKSEERDIVAGLKLGADDFVRKPFGKAELLARIHAALRRQRSHPDALPQFTFGDWTVFPTQLRAACPDHQIDLTPREVSLLRFFLNRAGEALTRDTLLDACWGIDYFPESRTLDQHIATLRKKIETDPAHPTLIETIRGIGYRHPLTP